MPEKPMPADAPLLVWLRERAAAVRKIESDAQAALYDRHDETAYRGLMKEKALLLSTIADDAAACFASAGEEACQALARDRLVRFAAGAKNALRIGSVFYMSALLYPDEHLPGEPNNLERLIIELEEAFPEKLL